MKKLCLAILLFILIPIHAAYAVKVASLYQADVPVPSQDDGVRNKAMRQGLVQVLMKISGDPDVGKSQALTPVLKHISDYVQEYSYSPSPVPTAKYIIHISYDAYYINQLLKKSGSTYWGESRPLILVWLAYTNPNQQTEVVSDDVHGDVLASMELEGKKLGLPLIFPVMDAADMNQVTTDQIVSMALPALQQAGQRYAPDALLIGHIQANPDGTYQSQWRLVLKENQWDWTFTDKTPDAIIASVINQASQSLAKHYVVKTTSNEPQVWLTLDISGVTQKDDLADVAQFLKQLTPVQQVQLSSVSGDVVEMSVLVKGSADSFMQSAEIGQHLRFVSREDDTRLVYEWVH